MVNITTQEPQYPSKNFIKSHFLNKITFYVHRKYHYYYSYNYYISRKARTFFGTVLDPILNVLQTKTPYYYYYYIIK